MEKVDKIIDGLKIFKKYGEVSVAAEHDEFFAGPSDLGTKISPEHKKELKKLGWMYQEKHDTWQIFT